MSVYRLGENKNRRVQLIMRPSLYKAAKERAEENEISFNEYISLLVENEIKKHLISQPVQKYRASNIDEKSLKDATELSKMFDRWKKELIRQREKVNNG